MSQPRLRLEVPADDGRYHRQELISWWEQARLAQARVLVIGAGALGNELLKNLVLLGVGNVLVVDMDRVENSNLSRCVLFREEDEGLPKASVAATRARKLNGDVKVAALVGDVRVDIGLNVFAAADLVLGGLDNREARLHINQCCWKTGTPWIDGAIEGLLGTVRVFVPPTSACYECTMNRRDHELLAARKSCALLTRQQMLEGRVPTTVTTASVVAGMQAQEAIKLLHRDRLAATFAGHGFAYNGLTHDSYVVRYPVRDDCLSHDSYDLEHAIPVDPDATFRDLLAEAQRGLADPVLDLEREIVVRFDCSACESTEVVHKALDRLHVGDVACSVCGADRSPQLTHSISAVDDELLALTPYALDLPRFDVVTARVGLTRHHFVVEGALDPFAALMNGQSQ